MIAINGTLYVRTPEHCKRAAVKAGSEIICHRDASLPDTVIALEPEQN